MQIIELRQLDTRASMKVFQAVKNVFCNNDHVT